MPSFKSFLADDSGAVSVEYGFAIMFAGVIATLLLTQIRTEVSDTFTGISNRLNNQVSNVK